jgi:hypothetical protein
MGSSNNQKRFDAPELELQQMCILRMRLEQPYPLPLDFAISEEMLKTSARN